MHDADLLAERFEAHRGHLRAVAYRMLGSLAEAEDTVQDAWLRVARADPAAVENLGGWLTTIVARLALDRLRSRAAHREEPLGVHVPEPIVDRPDNVDPEHEAILADSVGLAMLVVLETLTPAERLAFVLHDTFGLPFDEIAPIVERSPTATRQLASRARRRVRGSAAPSNVPRVRQWEIIDARADAGAGTSLIGRSREVRGAQAVAKQALGFARLAPGARRAMVNGAPGFVVYDGPQPFAILGFTFRDDSIAAIDILTDQERLARVDLSGMEQT